MLQSVFLLCEMFLAEANTTVHISFDFNITTIISVISLLLSLWNFFLNLYQNRLSIHPIYKAHRFESSTFLLQLAIENHSRSAICISRAFIEFNGKYSSEFSWKKSVVIRKYLENSELVEYSLNPPFEIDALGVISGIMQATFDESVKKQISNNSSCLLLLYTSKGIKKYPLTLNNPDIEVL